MTWYSHKVITASIVYGVTEDGLCVIPALFGSVFPDAVEYFTSDNWHENHRKSSHWFMLYLIPAILLLYFSMSFVVVKVFMFFLVGCLLHIFEDAITGKVPSFKPDKKIGARIIKNGTLIELLSTLIIAVAVGVMIIWRQ